MNWIHFFKLTESLVHLSALVCAFKDSIAEEAAWKFAKENGIDLVTMNPGFVIGPFLQPTINLTMEIILNLINGTIHKFMEIMLAV